MALQRMLVTGAAGFIGRAVMHRLAADGIEAVGVDIAARGDVPAAGWIGGGFSAEYLADDRLQGIDAVLHAAWTGFPGTRAGTPTELDRNVADTLDLFERARAAGVRRFVFLSSGGTVYGEPPAVPIGEETPLRPISRYGAAKASAELFLHALAHGGGTELVVLRLANPFGPGQLPWRGQGVIPTAIACALTGTPFAVWGNPDSERDYLYVDDVADALARALAPGGPAGTFNIGGGAGLSLGACLAAVERATGRMLVREAAGDRGVDVAHNVLDAGRFRDAFGWGPRTGFAEGIVRHRDWLVAHRARWSPPAI